MVQHKVNGYTVTAHKPRFTHRPDEAGVVILATVYLATGDYEYVVATMNDLNDPHWFSGFYTHNLVSAVNRYYEYA